MSHYRQAVQMLTELAMQTDKGIVLASALIGHLRRQSVILPALNAVERASAEAITRSTGASTTPWPEPLADAHRRRLDDLLKRRDNGKTARRLVGLAWCWPRQSRSQIRGICWNTSNASRHGRHSICLRHRAAGSPEPPAQDCPRGRPDDTRRPRPIRAATALRHSRGAGHRGHGHRHRRNHRPARPHPAGKLFNAAKNKHQQQFRASGKAINAGRYVCTGASVRR